MSATNQNIEREKDDAYYTPAWCVRALLRAVRLPSGQWLEPAAGDGAIIRAVETERPGQQEWFGYDIRPEAIRACLDSTDVEHSRFASGDFLADPFRERYSVAITNPQWAR